MRILGIERDETACNFYRVLQPLSVLQEQELADVKLIKEGADLASDMAIEHVMAADIIVFQRPSTESWFEFIKLCRKFGKIVVTDYDDDPFNTSPWNPYYRFVGTEEVSFKWPDGKVDLIWHEDMKGGDGNEDFFSIERNIHHRQMFQISFKKADMVTCTTDILREEFLKLNKNVTVLPNAIDPNFYYTPELVKKEVRIGWQGGVSHYEDLYMVRDSIKAILDRHSNTKFVYFGDPRFLGLFKGCNQSQIEFVPWCKHNAYPYKLALMNIDIGLCPIVDNRFNRNKSAIKWMEYSMVGASTVASKISPYSDVISHGNTGLLADPQEWEEAINRLVVNKRLRTDLAQNAVGDVIKNHNIWDKSLMWKEAYDKLLKGESLLK